MPLDTFLPNATLQEVAARTIPVGSRSVRALTLVEVMVSLTLMTTVMLGFIGTFVQSRRVTESSVLNAAATSMIYGMIEQIKQLDYSTSLPNNETDPFAPASQSPPYVRLRLSQSKVVWLSVVRTLASTAAAPTTPQGPTTTPAPNVTAASLSAVDNFIGAIPLSTVTGTTSQQISLNIWMWIDDIPDAASDVSEVKKITLVYTYTTAPSGCIRGAASR